MIGKPETTARRDVAYGDRRERLDSKKQPQHYVSDC